MRGSDMVKTSIKRRKLGREKYKQLNTEILDEERMRSKRQK
jgi:hypothetical protein